VTAFLADLVIRIAVVGFEDRRHVAFQDFDAHRLVEQDVIAFLTIPAMGIGHTVLANALDDKPYRIGPAHRRVRYIGRQQVN
jgi:hypothetical protein